MSFIKHIRLDWLPFALFGLAMLMTAANPTINLYGTFHRIPLRGLFAWPWEQWPRCYGVSFLPPCV